MEEHYTYETIEVIGYKYTLETEAISDRQLAANYMGFPVPGGETLYWVNYEYAKYDGFWYIRYVDGLEEVIGTPSNFNITIRNYITIIDN